MVRIAGCSAASAVMSACLADAHRSHRVSCLTRGSPVRRSTHCAGRVARLAPGRYHGGDGSIGDVCGSAATTGPEVAGVRGPGRVRASIIAGASWSGSRSRNPTNRYLPPITCSAINPIWVYRVEDFDMMMHMDMMPDDAPTVGPASGHSSKPKSAGPMTKHRGRTPRTSDWPAIKRGIHEVGE